jgi:hypothetical protein
LAVKMVLRECTASIYCGSERLLCIYLAKFLGILRDILKMLQVCVIKNWPPFIRLGGSTIETPNFARSQFGITTQSVQIFCMRTASQSADPKLDHEDRSRLEARLSDE